MENSNAGRLHSWLLAEHAGSGRAIDMGVVVPDIPYAVQLGPLKHSETRKCGRDSLLELEEQNFTRNRVLAR